MKSNNCYLVTDYGAVGDQQTLNTKFIQQTIDLVAQKGGGVVVIPPGQYLTGTIFLPSKTVLEIQSGAVLIASPDLKDYPPLEHGHNKDRQPYHLIVLDQVEDVWIRGGGRIEGSGQEFWYPRVGPGARPGNYHWYREREKRVSPLIEVVRSRKIKLQDITITNSPGWTCHFHCCQSVQINRIRIYNHKFGPNTDGLDINGCRDVLISDCQIETGDDAIVLKTTPDSHSCERVTISNCILQSNCVALKLGAKESYHDIREITISNCIVHHSNRVLGLYSLNGGNFEGITVNNIVGNTDNGMFLTLPIHFDLRRNNHGAGKISHVQISNFIARGQGRVLLTAEAGTQLSNIFLRDIHLSYPGLEDAAELIDILPSGSGTYSNNNPAARQTRSAFIAENVSNLFLDNLTVDWPEKSYRFDYYAFWGRNLRGGFLNLPLLRGFKGGDICCFDNCQLDYKQDVGRRV